MKSSDQWGPFAPDLDPGERLARTRSLRALARVLAGPRAADLVELLRQAETDESLLPAAADALDRLPSIDMRCIVGSYAGLVRSLAPARASKASGPQPRGRAWGWPLKPAGMPWAWSAVA